ncbi:MAG: class I tRNA ligase family protein [Planctomycetaceae bacterium]
MLNQLAPVRGLQQPAAAVESVMIAAWPELGTNWSDPALEKRFERLQQTVVAVRNVRAIYKISPKEPLKLFMKCSPEIAEQMQAIC